MIFSASSGHVHPVRDPWRAACSALSVSGPCLVTIEASPLPKNHRKDTVREGKQKQADDLRELFWPMTPTTKPPRSTCIPCLQLQVPSKFCYRPYPPSPEIACKCPAIPTIDAANIAIFRPTRAASNHRTAMVYTVTGAPLRRRCTAMLTGQSAELSRLSNERSIGCERDVKVLQW